jgi:hypothetical protein
MVELIRHADERTMLGAFRQRGKEILDEVAHGEHLHAPEVLAGDAVELLEEVAKKQGSTALMISRRAASRAGMTLERLGAVSRGIRFVEAAIRRRAAWTSPADLPAVPPPGGPSLNGHSRPRTRQTSAPDGREVWGMPARSAYA